MLATPRKKLIFFCLVVCCSLVTNGYAKSTPEYYAKAVFLFKVIDFVTWPDDHNDGDKLTRICIYGENPFDNYLQEIADTKNKDNTFVIHHTRNINTLSECHIVFISRSEEYNLTKIISHLQHKPMLTVSDIKKFAYKKGMIELGVHSRKRNFELKMNVSSVNRSGISLSSNLIELAIVIYGYNNKEQPR